MSEQKKRPARPTTETEAALWSAGHRLVAGLDEAGRGAWAGPVYAAAVVLPRDVARLERLAEVRDSKRMTARQREEQFEVISRAVLALGVGWATAEEIDGLRIVAATRLAMRRAMAALQRAGRPLRPHALIIDALALPEVPLPQRYFPYADATSLSVAAAGIVAKVSRDRWMAERAEIDHPGYGFAQHKGYGTPQHREAVDRLGPCAIHRKSFAPIAQRLLQMGLELRCGEDAG